jgi:F-type H+-transporting ATPase subunit gamma
LATLREIRRRIRSVKNISQVTRAMQMVAASKMRRAQEQVLATREYSQKAWELLVHLAGQPTDDVRAQPLCGGRSVRAIGLVLITGDRGLSGGYNHNIIRLAIRFIQQQQNPVKVITVGRKGREYMLRLGADLVAEFTDLPARPSLLNVLPIAQVAVEDLQREVFDEVYLAYTLFHNTMHHEPIIRKLLPICGAAESSVGSGVTSGILPELAQPQPVTVEYIYEPDAQALLSTIIPRFTELQIYQAILESLASEHSARMVAMRNATENALEMIDGLTLTYNRARQEAITEEIIDIVGGSEALAKSRAG